MRVFVALSRSKNEHIQTALSTVNGYMEGSAFIQLIFDGLLLCASFESTGLKVTELVLKKLTSQGGMGEDKKIVNKAHPYD